MLKHKLKITDLCNILIGNVKKLVSNFFEEEKYVLFYENVQLYLRLGLKFKKMHCILELNQSQCLKPHIESNLQNRIEAEESREKMEKPCTNY